MDINIEELIKLFGTVMATATAAVTFFIGIHKFIVKPFKSLNSLLGINSEKLNKTLNLIDSKIVPFMESIEKEFAINSGKTIKDQLVRIEDNLMVNDMRVKALNMNNSAVGMYECDEKGACVWLNDVVAEIWGREKHDLLDSGWLTGISSEEREEVWEKWLYSVTHHIPYEDRYTVVNAKSGEEIKIETTALCLKGSSGKVLAYLGTVTRL